MKILSLGVLALAATAPALAQNAPAVSTQAAPPARDAVQTRAEVGAHVQAMFARLDANKDGFIARDETQNVAKQMREGRAKGPGAAAPAQREQRRAQAFDRLDTDRNGSISREEFARAGDQRADHRGDRQGKMAGQRMGMGGFGGRMFETADANRDGKVSLQEATSAAYQHFDMADANRDGRLTREERMQAHQKMRAQSPRG